MNQVYIKRYQNAVRVMNERGVEGLFLTFLPHIRYFTGFKGSFAYALIDKERIYLVTDQRYAIQAPQEVYDHVDVYIIETDLRSTLKEVGFFKKSIKVGFEGKREVVQTMEYFKQVFESIDWLNIGLDIEVMMGIKDEEELKNLKIAIEMTDQVFDEVLETVRVDMSEKELAAFISYQCRLKGADGDSYEPIVASGPNSALPHARPTERLLKDGDILLMDFGALYNGYHADMTRTIFIGEASTKQKEIYESVRRSQLKGIEVAQAGKTAHEVDQACRLVFEEENLSQHFMHSTGHGIGVEVHTYPSLSPNLNVKLQENFVVTIEPGLYFEGWGGIRIEDDCLIEKGCCIPLNRSSKDLIEIK